MNVRRRTLRLNAHERRFFLKFIPAGVILVLVMYTFYLLNLIQSNVRFQVSWYLGKISSADAASSPADEFFLCSLVFLAVPLPKNIAFSVY